MNVVSRELALGMALALESSEREVERAQDLLGDRGDPDAARDLAAQLLGRARKRIEAVRLALGENFTAFTDP